MAAAHLLLIHTNDELRALANIFGTSMVELKTLDALRTAPEMYQTLHTLVRGRNWACDELPILQGFSELARNVENLRLLFQSMLPNVMPYPVLEGNGSILHTIAHIRLQGAEIQRAKKTFKFGGGGLQRQAHKLGRLLYNELQRVLDGSMPLNEFQTRIPTYITDIDRLLGSRMNF